MKQLGKGLQPVHGHVIAVHVQTLQNSAAKVDTKSLSRGALHTYLTDEDALAATGFAGLLGVCHLRQGLAA